MYRIATVTTIAGLTATLGLLQRSGALPVHQLQVAHPPPWLAVAVLVALPTVAAGWALWDAHTRRDR
jgi:hypothetical protein